MKNIQLKDCSRYFNYIILDFIFDSCDSYYWRLHHRFFILLLLDC